MSFNYNGYGVNCITIPRETSAAEFTGPAIVDSNGGVAKAPNGTDVYAVVIAARKRYCTVQTSGYVELKFSGTAPSYGRVKIASDGQGGVASNSSGAYHTVLKVDNANKIVGFII